MENHHDMTSHNNHGPNVQPGPALGPKLVTANVKLATAYIKLAVRRNPHLAQLVGRMTEEKRATFLKMACPRMARILVDLEQKRPGYLQKWVLSQEVPPASSNNAFYFDKMSKPAAERILLVDPEEMVDVLVSSTETLFVLLKSDICAESPFLFDHIKPRNDTDETDNPFKAPWVLRLPDVHPKVFAVFAAWLTPAALKEPCAPPTIQRPASNRIKYSYLAVIRKPYQNTSEAESHIEAVYNFSQRFKTHLFYEEQRNFILEFYRHSFMPRLWVPPTDIERLSRPDGYNWLLMVRMAYWFHARQHPNSHLGARMKRYGNGNGPGSFPDPFQGALGRALLQWRPNESGQPSPDLEVDRGVWKRWLVLRRIVDKQWSGDPCFCEPSCNYDFVDQFPDTEEIDYD